MYLCLLLILSSFNTSMQKSTPEDDHYVAAVVEFQLSMNITANTDRYIGFIREAKMQDADIIVFPESTLTNEDTAVKVPIHDELKSCPSPAQCPTLYDELLVSLSSAAREHEIYVLVNLQEEMDCTESDNGEYCPENKVYLFNTNVVFDRQGTIIDRYRKMHMFLEPTLIPALDAKLGIFSTDFGVTFGHLICFDMLFQAPTLQLVQKHKITDILYPSFWFSELPMLTSVQVQQAFSVEMNINLIAAGGNNVALGTAGSGIYSGKAGALIGIYRGVPTTRLLVAKVPKIPGEKCATEEYPGFILQDPADINGLYTNVDSTLESHVTRPLVLGFQEFTLQHRDVTCKFRVRLREKEGRIQYKYRAGAYTGVRDLYTAGTVGVRTCAVYACLGDDISTCGKRFGNTNASMSGIFEELNIVGTIPKPCVDSCGVTDATFFAHAQSATLMPLSVQEFSHTVVRTKCIESHELELKNTAELYSFGLWGRKFKSDGSEPDEKSENYSAFLAAVFE